MYSGMAMNKKTEMLPKLVWYIVIIIPTKNSVIIMLYRGIGTSFKLGIRTRLTIKNANVTNTVMRTIFGMVCENNVKKATSPPAAVIGTPVKYFIEVDDGVTLNRAKRYAPNSGNNPAMYSPMIP